MLIKYHLFKNKLPMLNTAMGAYSLRQRVIAENIANANTPDYTPKQVKFEDFFKAAGNNPSVSGVEGGGYTFTGYKKKDDEVKPEVEDQVIPEPEEYFTGDNHVNIDKEMSELAKNQIRFRLAGKMTKFFFSDLNSSIRGQRQ